MGEQRAILSLAKKQAREEAERLETQAAINRIYRTEIERAERKIKNHGRWWRWTKTGIFWLVLLGISIPLSGGPLVAYLIYRMVRESGGKGNGSR